MKSEAYKEKEREREGRNNVARGAAGGRKKTRGGGGSCVSAFDVDIAIRWKSPKAERVLLRTSRHNEIPYPDLIWSEPESIRDDMRELWVFPGLRVTSFIPAMPDRRAAAAATFFSAVVGGARSIRTSGSFRLDSILFGGSGDASLALLKIRKLDLEIWKKRKIRVRFIFSKIQSPADRSISKTSDFPINRGDSRAVKTRPVLLSKTEKVNEKHEKAISGIRSLGDTRSYTETVRLTDASEACQNYICTAFANFRV